MAIYPTFEHLVSLDPTLGYWYGNALHVDSDLLQTLRLTFTVGPPLAQLEGIKEERCPLLS
jgi:hypothetical protein